MKLWLTSDTHFNHANIIKYCDRPFIDVSHMNTILTQNWNSVVNPEDWVIHCGDVCMGRWDDANSVVRALSGHKILLLGNHDRPKFVNVYKTLGWHVLDSLLVGDVLFQHHYINDAEVDYDLVIHGHSHGTFSKEKHVDVGVDVKANYSPIDARSVISDKRVVYILGLLCKMFKV